MSIRKVLFLCAMLLLARARVVVITKPGKRDRTNVKSYRCISLLPTIAKLVEKATTLHLSIQGDSGTRGNTDHERVKILPMHFCG
jgi:hypothetical protein